MGKRRPKIATLVYRRDISGQPGTMLSGGDVVRGTAGAVMQGIGVGLGIVRYRGRYTLYARCIVGSTATPQSRLYSLRYASRVIMRASDVDTLVMAAEMLDAREEVRVGVIAANLGLTKRSC